MHIAAVDNSIDDIIALLKSGSDVNAVDNNGWTPLITAADKGNLETILCLLQTNDIDIGRQSINGCESVVHKMAAATMQDDEGYKRKWCGVMKILKSKGANLNDKNEFGEFPIHIAVKRGNVVAVTWLGENGANINAANKYAYFLRFYYFKYLILINFSIVWEKHLFITLFDQRMKILCYASVQWERINTQKQIQEKVL